MNGAHPTGISVVEPISPAIARAKTILFQPFDLMKWLTIGFCAWLAQLAEPNGGGGGGGGGRGNGVHYNVERRVDDARDFVQNNLDWIIPVGIVVGIAFIGLWLLLLWLSSRGRFMFLDCVARNKAEVTAPWHRFRTHGNSLFAFRVVLGLIAIVTAILPFVIGTIFVVTSTATLGFGPVSILGIVAGVLYFIAVMIVIAIVGKLTKDFVVPIMYLHTTSSTRAWRMFLDLLSPNKARFFLYLLFQIAIWAALGAMLFMAACCTCCCAACLFLLPYVGTVILLPVHVFTRSYSLYYLAQYGPELNVFAPRPGETPIPSGPQG